MSKVCGEMCLRKRCATAPQETTSSNETLQPERMVINHDVCTSGSYTRICTNSSTKLDCLLLILIVVLTRFSALTFRIEFLGGSARLTTRTPRVSYWFGSWVDPWTQHRLTACITSCLWMINELICAALALFEGISWQMFETSMVQKWWEIVDLDLYLPLSNVQLDL